MKIKPGWDVDVIRESPPHFADHVHIPAGLDLHLDALVARRELRFDFLEKLRHRLLDSDRDPARNFAPRSAADVLIERPAEHARFQIPNCALQASTRHVVPTFMPRACPYFIGA